LQRWPPLIGSRVSLSEGPGYAAVGPKTFPIIVGIGIVLSGLGVALTRNSDGPAPDEGLESHDWRTLGLFAALLALYIALFLILGFVLCSILLVVAGARILGSHSWRRDLIAGVGLSLTAYLIFTMLLGLELPAGPLELPLQLLRPRG
jgi:putative tricarboxylic transport membrane protein